MGSWMSGAGVGVDFRNWKLLFLGIGVRRGLLWQCDWELEKGLSLELWFL
jgi:hypothetical protein